ncbi:MAG: hypothetical protein HYX74_05185 [Acidobacteria bacterium]|nr:hypothetical protein [Acidobacteriota bacterium]
MFLTYRTYRTVAAGAVALSLLLPGAVTAQQKAEPMASPLKLTAADCKSCHLKNHQEWEQSYHAKSVVSMQAGFKKYITTQEQAKGRPLNRHELMACIGCHAPAMRFASDGDFARLAQLVKTDQTAALAGLNVDCIACHALMGSGHPDQKPADEMAKQVFYGTIKNPVRSVHGNQYAPEMEKSEFCKSCHTYVTPAEMKVNADWDIVCTLTYDAWVAGPHGPRARQADIKQCQTCHMEKSDGKAANVAAAPARKVSGHLFPGWHDAAALQRAAEISLASKPGAKAGTAELVVTVDNKAGHRIPDT